MLGILGLFGALVAGIMAETMIGGPTAADKDSPEPDDAGDGAPDQPDLLDNPDLLEGDDGMPASNDRGDPVDADETLNGGDADAMAKSGLALTCLKHSLPGDASLFGQADIDAFMSGNLDVRR